MEWPEAKGWCYAAIPLWANYWINHFIVYRVTEIVYYYCDDHLLSSMCGEVWYWSYESYIIICGCLLKAMIFQAFPPCVRYIDVSWKLWFSKHSRVRWRSPSFFVEQVSTSAIHRYLVDQPMAPNPCDMVDFNTVVYSFESLWYSLYGEEMNDMT